MGTFNEMNMLQVGGLGNVPSNGHVITNLVGGLIVCQVLDILLQVLDILLLISWHAHENAYPHL